MLLEDDETQTLARKTVNRCSKTSWLQNDSYPTACWNITRDHRAHLVWSNRDFFAYWQIYLQYLLSYILKFLICIHAGNPRVPPRALASGPKPCGVKNRPFFVVVMKYLTYTRTEAWFLGRELSEKCANLARNSILQLGELRGKCASSARNSILGLIFKVKHWFGNG